MNKLLCMLSMVSLSIVFGAFATQASADEGAKLYVIKSVNINAPAAKTWDKVAKFGDLGAWHPAVAKTELTGTEAKVGATRVLTLQDGGKIHEKLTAYSAQNKSMSYMITESVLPVDDYVSTIRVLPNGANQSVLVWEGTFKAKAPNADKVASDTINGVYEGGLSNLKKILE